jgi:hypothetical protein
MYIEHYKAHALVFPGNKIPEFRHLAAGFAPESMELRAAGRVTRDGEELEFQDIRVYLREEAR